MKIEDLTVGQGVISDVDGESGLYSICEINDDGTVNIENCECGEEDVPPSELRPIPDMPEQLFIDMAGTRRVHIKNGQFVQNMFFPSEERRFFHIEADGLGFCDKELTPDQIVMAKIYAKME